MSNVTSLKREARWREIVRRQAAGEWCIAEFCRREGVALSTFHWWRRRLSGNGLAAVEWIEAQGAGLPSAAPTAAGPAVRAGTGTGLWIEFSVPPEPALLVAALTALHSARCTSC